MKDLAREVTLEAHWSDNQGDEVYLKSDVDAMLKGKVLVPVEPTKEMVFSACIEIGVGYTTDDTALIKRIYKAMLKASGEGEG